MAALYLRVSVLKKFCLLFIFVALISKLSAFELKQNDYNQIDEYLLKAVNAYHIPGLAFILTDSEGTLFSNTYGQFTDKNRQIFIGSESKSFTALCIMQLEEKGLLNLDDDFTKYLPQYHFDKKISVRALLNQTSGFDNHAKLINFKITETYGSYEYANVNYDLLGMIVEAVSGKSYAEYLRENVLEPLGMNNTFGDCRVAKARENKLLGNRNWFGFFVKSDALYPGKRSWFHEPAGYIASTPADYEKYLRMYLNYGVSENGERILSETGIRRMWYENVSIYDSGARYGMGFNSEPDDYSEMIYHAGQVENSITFMVIFPQKNLAMNFMVNSGDEFGVNNLMQDVAASVMSFLADGKFNEVQPNAYFKTHLVLDIFYLLLILVAVLILILTLKGKPRNKIAKIVFAVIAYVIFPLFLLYGAELTFRTPLWTVKLFVPDLFCVIVLSVILCELGAVIRIARKMRA